MNKINFDTIEFENTVGDYNSIEFYFNSQCDDVNIVQNSLRAMLKPNETNKYIIYGKLKKNTTVSPISVSIKLYLGKRNFLDGSVSKCENTLTLGFLKLLTEN